MVNSGELAEAMKKEILELMNDWVIPHNVHEFSVLHKYVDANCLGGTDELLDELTDLYTENGEPIPGEVFTKAMEELIAIASPAIEEVDFWLKQRWMQQMHVVAIR